MTLRKAAVVLAAVLAFPTLASAQSKLKVEAHTGTGEGFFVNATLISGDKDVVLVDAMFTLADAHRLTARLLESKKNLTTIFVTHSHPDHYFGLVVLKQAFPKAKIVAPPSAVAAIKKSWKAKVAQWGPMYGANLPAKPLVPTALKGSTLTLEGEAIEVVANVQGDDAANSYLWVPSLKAVIAGDIVYDGVHPWTAETSPESRKAWIATLDQIAARKPAIVVPGHQTPDMKLDPKNVEFTKKYLQAFDEHLAAAKTSDDLQSKMKVKYGKLALDIILKIGADAAFAGKSPAK